MDPFLAKLRDTVTRRTALVLQREQLDAQIAGIDVTLAEVARILRGDPPAAPVPPSRQLADVVTPIAPPPVESPAPVAETPAAPVAPPAEPKPPIVVDTAPERILAYLRTRGALFHRPSEVAEALGLNLATTRDALHRLVHTGAKLVEDNGLSYGRAYRIRPAGGGAVSVPPGGSHLPRLPPPGPVSPVPESEPEPETIGGMPIPQEPPPFAADTSREDAAALRDKAILGFIRKWGAASEMLLVKVTPRRHGQSDAEHREDIFNALRRLRVRSQIRTINGKVHLA